jgi:chitin synthase
LNARSTVVDHAQTCPGVPKATTRCARAVEGRRATDRAEQVETDLGIVKAGDNNVVDVSVPSDEKDINAAYEDAWAVLKRKEKPPPAKVDEETRMQDSYRNLRTNVVLAWTISNVRSLAVPYVDVLISWVQGALVAAILCGRSVSREMRPDHVRSSTGASANIATSGSSAKVNGYMAFLLFSVAGLALIRAIGCVIYLISWLFTGWCGCGPVDKSRG